MEIATRKTQEVHALYVSGLVDNEVCKCVLKYFVKWCWVHSNTIKVVDEFMFADILHRWQEAHKVALHKASLGQHGEKGNALKEIKYNSWSTKAASLFVVQQRHLQYMCMKHDINEELNKHINNYGAFLGKDGFTTCFNFTKK
ncbi:uncharacterized protein ACA1_386820 [Acanthamoeba castellanii str. Neff]|uniref:Uncharacterized protein n=1 Tax=Acanthamoeba castellanii (strain ATCC 30010 / Neff) TaxID=1257118 RepID=L8HAU6_ACACF|nr:uncharacterized protein ACA1_386820 [Acanthamoeba castellanii str. Neff]ELR21853.1 hypothetical protein ACA1_386820 [Acanthamoeba castellanii str. Neff]